MTIYGLYAQNGHRAGFWVQHRSWTNTCAQVQSIAGRQAGALEGTAPLYGSPEVRMRVFDVRSGRPMQNPPSLMPPHDRSYTRIAEPSWYDRSLDAKELADGKASDSQIPHQEVFVTAASILKAAAITSAATKANNQRLPQNAPKTDARRERRERREQREHRKSRGI